MQLELAATALSAGKAAAQSEPALTPDPTLQARHQALGIPLFLAIMPIHVAGQINLFRQWRPATHPCIDRLPLAVAGQRLKSSDVGAIHDPWLGVEMRRDSRGKRRSWLG